MQGELREIDIRSILQLIEVGQRTGELLIEAYPALSNGTSIGDPAIRSDDSSSPVTSMGGGQARMWFIFFVHGRIVYTSDGTGTTQRLHDYLRRHNVTDHENFLQDTNVASGMPEYACLWSLLEQGKVTPKQGRSILRSMIRETLFDLLGLHQGSFVFEMNSPLSPTLVSVESSSLVQHVMRQVQSWKQLYPHVHDPSQCPYIDNHQTLKASLKPSNYNTLREWTKGDISIRQIARYLNRDVVSVARALYPYVMQGIVHLSPARVPTQTSFQATSTIQIPRVVCIDDGRVVRQTVESILTGQGYDTFVLDNPLDALGQVFQIKPDLILCDIAMPELDGYEVCAMLRKSTAFRQIPIVMLTGKGGFIDRLKARMVGATDYLTKPFSDVELLTVVERCIGAGAIASP